jgi:hypothetical protein
MSNVGFEMAKDWEKKAVKAATPGIQRKWTEFCARMKGMTPAEIRFAVKREWDGDFSDEAIAMLSRGEPIEARIKS